MQRRSALAVAAAAVLICGVNATADEFALQREGHPRLEMTPDDLARLRADASEVRSAQAAADAVLERERTETYRDYYVSLPQPEFPPEHDDGWPYWTGLCAELRSYMVTAARGYALTGDRRHLAWCRELMLTLAGWRQWTDPWYGTQPCLDTHHLTRGMCVALDLLWDALPDEDRETIIDAIAEKSAEFMHDYGNREESYVSTPGRWPNGYAAINTELGVAGLTLLGEHERAEAWLSQALDKARLFFDEQGGVDGGLVEGFHYGSGAIDNLMYLVCKSDAITGVNLFDHPYLSQAIYFPAYFVAPGGGSVPNFGDNGGPEGCSPTLIGLANAMVEVQQSPVAAWYLVKAGVADAEARRLAEPPTHLPLARHFRDIDWVAMRSGWGDEGSLLAFKCGHVAHHNHLDQNSFILAWDDEWLLNDPGYQIYNRPYPPERNMTEEMIHERHSYTYGTYGHNSIIVDGMRQKPVRGHIAGFATTPALSYAVGDASDCYEELSRYHRHIVSVAPDYYVVFDDIATDGQKREIALLLHTTPDGRFSVDGRELPVGQQTEGARATVRRGGEAVMRFVEPAELLFEHRQWPYCEEYGHFLSASAGRMGEGTLAWVVAAGPRGGVDLDARSCDAEGATALQVRVEDGVDTIALASGDGPASARDVRFEGALAMVRDSRSGVHRYGLVAGTRLSLGEAELVAGDAPISVGATLDEHLLRASIRCDEAASVTLFCPIEPGMVRLNGVEEPVDVSFEQEARRVSLALPAGEYCLEVREL